MFSILTQKKLLIPFISRILQSSFVFLSPRILVPMKVLCCVARLLSPSIKIYPYVILNSPKSLIHVHLRALLPSCDDDFCLKTVHLFIINTHDGARSCGSLLSRRGAAPPSCSLSRFPATQIDGEKCLSPTRLDDDDTNFPLPAIEKQISS